MQLEPQAVAVGVQHAVGHHDVECATGGQYAELGPGARRTLVLPAAVAVSARGVSEAVATYLARVWRAAACA